VPSLLWGIHPVSLSIRKRKYKGENPREGPPHVEAELNAQIGGAPVSVHLGGLSCLDLAESPEALYPIKWALSVKDSVGLAYL
jgi:hypothetical protein